jgi:hypothetical protein
MAKQQQGVLDNHLQCEPGVGVFPVHLVGCRQQDSANQLEVLGRIFESRWPADVGQGECEREITAYWL